MTIHDKFYNHDTNWLTFCFCFSKDNAGKDENEFVEIGCNANIDLTGYKIVLYNGNDRTFYDEKTLSGFEAQCSPTGSLAVQNYDNVIQNGAPDGIALIDKNEVVVEFISYEGSFEAANGLAKGQTSVDVGVSEDSKSMEGMSLQLVGEGCTRSDFTWQTAKLSTKGKVNDGQNICVSMNCFHGFGSLDYCLYRIVMSLF